MKYALLARNFGISLSIVILLAFIIAPSLTSLLRQSELIDSALWKNGGLIDPNGAPMSLLALSSYLIAGVIISRLISTRAVMFAALASMVYVAFQIWNFGGFTATYDFPHPFGAVAVFIAVVGLTTLGAYIGKHYLFAQSPTAT